MQIDIPGRAPLTLEHAVFDLNGTYTEVIVSGHPDYPRAS